MARSCKAAVAATEKGLRGAVLAVDARFALQERLVTVNDFKLRAIPTGQARDFDDTSGREAKQGSAEVVAGQSSCTTRDGEARWIPGGDVQASWLQWLEDYPEWASEQTTIPEQASWEGESLDLTG